MDPFTCETLPGRVIFGSATLARLGEEIAHLDAGRALILSTPGREAGARALAAQVGPLAAGVFAGAAMHTPVSVTETAMRMLDACGADCLVAMGGGSAIGLGKALALRTDLPQIAIPTTYAGSEMTPLIGETENGVKKTQSTRKVLPETVIYDVDLTLTLPPMVTATSGLNAVAHAAEALYSPGRNPVTALLAEEAIRQLTTTLPRVLAAPAAPAGRSDALYGAWLCGICLGSVPMGLHHKLCHVLGGALNLPHAETHAILLPHAVGYAVAGAPQAAAALCRALGAADPGSGLRALVQGLGVTMGLRDLGMPEDAIDTIADTVMAAPPPNPRPLERDGIRAALRQAWAGTGRR